jgi:flagellar basal-body rod protein FlgB
VANANTPSYRAKDIVPFESFLDSAQLAMATSNERHINVSASELEAPPVEQDQRGETTHSGNNVSLENELLKLGETNSQFALNTGLIKSFNRMITASLK